HRFDSAQLINIDLSYPDDFDLKEYVEKGGFGILNSDKIIIFVGRFQLKQGQHLFETPLSSDQVVTMEADGWFTLKASVPDTMYFRWWLLSLGDKVEVLEPNWLKDKIVETTRHTLSLYE
ncbi:YafY family protein, partial [Oleiphilus sp. HI0132]